MSVVYDMGKNVVKSKDWVNVVIMIISFCLSYFLNVNHYLYNTFGSCIWNGTDNSKRRQR